MDTDDILSVMQKITEEDLVQIRDIGPETAHGFVRFMEDNADLVARLLAELNIKIPDTTENASKVLTGKSFCVTGSFEGISRDEIHELIEQNGGEVRTSVSKKLDYLIAGEKAGSKKTKAEGFGVEILTIEDFREMI